MAAMVNENFQNVGKLQTVDTRPFSGQAWGQGYMLVRRLTIDKYCVYQWYYNVQLNSGGGQPCLRDKRASALSAKFCTDHAGTKKAVWFME